MRRPEHGARLGQEGEVAPGVFCTQPEPPLGVYQAAPLDRQRGLFQLWMISGPAEAQRAHEARFADQCGRRGALCFQL